MIILNNEKIVSRSGPVKSIFLLKQKIFKNKKIFYIFTDKNYLFDILVGKKENIKKKFFYLFTI